MATFGVSEEILDKALKRGILAKRGDSLSPVPGYVSLTYIPLFGAYVLAYGTNASDAGYVRVDRYGEEWELKDAD